jgi:hypothetical protein
VLGLPVVSVAGCSSGLAGGGPGGDLAPGVSYLRLEACGAQVLGSPGQLRVVVGRAHRLPGQVGQRGVRVLCLGGKHEDVVSCQLRLSGDARGWQADLPRSVRS